MHQNTELKFTTPMLDFETHEPIRKITLSKSIDLGLKNDIEVEANKDKFPIITFAIVFNELFSVISLPSRNDFGLYNNVLTDIRNAKFKESDTITIDKTDLEKIKKLMEKGIAEKPEYNEKIGFIHEVIDQTITNIIIENQS